MATQETAPSLRDVQEWAKSRGPELIRKLNQAGGIDKLTAHEQRELAAIKAICPCHFTDHPSDYYSNRENCDFCGRPK